MSVQAKFQVQEIKHVYAGEGNDAATITMQAVTTGEGNESWSKWTPSGELTMHVTNPDAIAKFKIGKPYLLTFEEYDEPAA